MQLMMGGKLFPVWRGGVEVGAAVGAAEGVAVGAAVGVVNIAKPLMRKSSSAVRAIVRNRGAHPRPLYQSRVSAEL
jgi:hypothetical protein